MSVREYGGVNAEVDAKLNDAGFFVGTEYYQLFDYMRVADPVHWTESPAGNRDEEVFEEPYKFDISRHPYLHIGFGAVPHFCLAGPLPKIELRSAMEELLERYRGVEITGAVEYVQSSFVGGLKHLLVRLLGRN